MKISKKAKSVTGAGSNISEIPYCLHKGKTSCPLCRVEVEMAIEDAKQKIRYLSKWAKNRTQENILAAIIVLLEGFYKIGAR